MLTYTKQCTTNTLMNKFINTLKYHFNPLNDIKSAFPADRKKGVAAYETIVDVIKQKEPLLAMFTKHPVRGAIIGGITGLFASAVTGDAEQSSAVGAFIGMTVDVSQFAMRASVQLIKDEFTHS